jgi:hypothetical protein
MTKRTKKEARAMYQLNEIDLWRERHQELRRETENERLARRLRVTQRAPRTTNVGQISPLRRAAGLWGRTSIPFFRA